MNSTAIWIIVAICLFVLGNLFGLRLNPREKALGQLRERARKLGLQPRLVPLPDWVAPAWPTAARPANRRPMVAFYHLILPQGTLPHIQALVQQGQLQVQHGPHTLQDLLVSLPGAYAVELQANSAGLYWDEEADLHGTHLQELQSQLKDLATAAGYRPPATAPDA